MQNNLIKIDQTLHGYVNGHHLLASSVKLSEISKREMEVLSDLSGSDVQKGFREYFTGYKLSVDKKAVLSRTWYADEMERPGCVWTHSLIFDIEEFNYLFNKIDLLLGHFIRPDMSIGFSTYADSILLSNNVIEDYAPNRSKIEYLIWAIWGNKSPSIILAETSEEFAGELIFLWLQQNNDFNPRFSFSTGSLTLRKYKDEILSLQIVPKSISNSVLGAKSKCEILHEMSSIKSFPLWVVRAAELQWKDRWLDFNKFRSKFDSKNVTSDSLASFIKIYIGAKAERKQMSIVDGLNVIEKAFPVSEKAYVAKEYLQLFFDEQLSDWISSDCCIDLLQYLIYNDLIDVSLSHANIETLVKKSLTQNISGSKTLLKELSNMSSNELANSVLEIFAQQMPIEYFIDITNMELDVCKALIAFNINFAVIPCLWQNQSLDFQNGIIESIKKSKMQSVECRSIIYAILDNSTFDYSNDINNVFGKEAINPFLDYLLNKRTLSSGKYSALKSLCGKNQDICLRRMTEEIDILTAENFMVLFDIFDSYKNKHIIASPKLWDRVFSKIDVATLKKSKAFIALFYLPILLQSDYKFPISMASYTFETVHELLAEQKISDEDWWKISDILPYPSFFEQWDRCKRLRKGIKKKGYAIKSLEDKYQSDSDLDIHLL